MKHKRLPDDVRAQRLAPVERDLRRKAYPPEPEPWREVVMGPPSPVFDPLRGRVNAQAVVDELDALRARVKDAERERDEARAEVESLRGLLRSERDSHRSMVDTLRAEVERLKEQVKVACLLSRKNREEADRARAQLAQVQAKLDAAHVTIGEQLTTAGRGYVSPERLRELLERAASWDIDDPDDEKISRIVKALLKEAQGEG